MDISGIWLTINEVDWIVKFFFSRLVFKFFFLFFKIS